MEKNTTELLRNVRQSVVITKSERNFQCEMCLIFKQQQLLRVLISLLESRIDMLQEICLQKKKKKLNGLILPGYWTSNGKGSGQADHASCRTEHEDCSDNVSLKLLLPRAQESLQGLRTGASQSYFVSTFLDLPRALFSLGFFCLICWRWWWWLCFGFGFF